MAGFSQGFDQVPRRSAEAFLGQVTEDSQLRRYASGINQNPQAVEIWTVQVTSDPGDDVAGTLTFNFDGIVADLAINTESGPGVNEIAANIAAQANAEPLVRGRVTATVATDTVTFTGNNPGEVFSVTEAESWLGTPANTQNAADADAIPFARAVVRTGHNTSNTRPEGDHLVALASEALFTPQVTTLTVDTGTAVQLSFQVFEVRGNEDVLICSGNYAGSATQATEATNLRAAINGAAPANTVVAAGASADVTLTAEIAGLEFKVQTSSAGTSQVATTGPSPATSLNRAFAGVSTYSLNDEAATIGASEAEYGANEGVRYLQTGTIAVESTEALTNGGTVFVELAAGANAGKLYAAAGADRVALDKRIASWVRRTFDGLDFGVLNLQYSGA